MSKIQWTEMTWNPISGCSKISPGCANCYAEVMAKRLKAMGQTQYQNVTNSNGWNGHLELVEHLVRLPFRRLKPTVYFVNSMSDVGHDNVKQEWLDKIFAVMLCNPQHIFQVLTKRPRNLEKYLSNIEAPKRWREYAQKHWAYMLEPRHQINFDAAVLPNVWIGTSVESQKYVDRVDILRRTNAAIKFLSCEPLLGELELDLTGISWVIVGGESGHGSRPCHIDWIRSIVNQCQSANVPVFVKQLGANSVLNTYVDGIFVSDYRLKTSDKKGGEITEFPTDLQIREFPKNEIISTAYALA